MFWKKIMVGLFLSTSMLSVSEPLPAKGVKNIQKIQDDSADFEITNLNTIEKWEIIQEPTCSHEGLRKKTDINKNTITEKIPKLGHDFVKSCCRRCGLLQTLDKNDHTLILTKKIYSKLGLPQNGDIVIPETVVYDGITYSIVGIGASLFRFNEDLYSITLPDTIRYIEPFAFESCENLQYCNLPDGLLRIGYAAFQCCYQLKNLELPDSVQIIGNFSYNHCSNLENETLHIPRNLQCLGEDPRYPAHMFYDCGKKDTFSAFSVDEENKNYKAEGGILYTKNGETLVSIPKGKKFPDQTYVMPDTVKNLGELSFSRNDDIKRLVISDSLRVDGEMKQGESSEYLNIGNDLSVACYAYSDVGEYLTKKTNPNYVSVDGILYTKDKKHLVAIPNHYKGIIHIPEGTEIWDKEALWTDIVQFKDLAFKDVTEIHLPASLKTIDSEQFEVLNRIVDIQGVKIAVDSSNDCFITDQTGYLLTR